MAQLVGPIAIDSKTERIASAVAAALGAYRDALDADEFLIAVSVEVRLVARYDDPTPGRDVGDVRSVVVSPRSMIRTPR